MTIDHLFTTPILIETVNFHSLKKLKSFCLKQEKTLQSRQVSNKGGWQSIDITKDGYGKKLGYDLFFMFDHFVQKYCEFLGVKTNIRISNTWININKNTDYNSSHIHPGSIFSGIFYVSVPSNNQSVVTFNRPNMLEEYFYRTIFAGANISSCFNFNVSPKEGMVLIFPSYIEHKVSPSNSNQKRISIAFNTEIKC